ncbi:MAG: dienelactone hydrolase family protein [Bdellovibrionales bacterium]|nr:dienelactone hydrolase family protein [Bdellovibrionales bacterium]
MKYLMMICILATSFSALAEIKTEEISYHADVPLKGFIAYDDALQAPLPGVLIVHEWWGHNQNTRDKALAFAKAGFVAMALDMYGEGKTTEHPKEATEFMNQALASQDVANVRFEQALKVLQAHARTNAKKIGAVGYCFGGKVVLDQARQGTKLTGVVSIHGGLFPMKNDKNKKIKTPILVLHGEEDPMVSDALLVSFTKEMETKGADFEFVSFPGVVHAFTNPGATEVGKKFNLPLAYDEKADKEAHEKAIAFLIAHSK